MFAFDLYDNDSSGELSASEVARMLQDIYGKKEVKNNFLAKR
jgi:Ca2+-binding EF-hand superfamily protein